MNANLLIKGENLKTLPWLIDNKQLGGKIDLIYIDPPFATNNNFTISNGRSATISNARNGNLAYSDKLTGNGFIDFLRKRLIWMRELLSDSGSIYLHIDYKIGHYVKILLDEIFGAERFINDITRIKCNPKNFPRLGFGNVKDMILFYSKTGKPIWHEPHQPYTEADIARLFPKITPDGRRYTTVPIHAPGETANGKTNQPFRGILPPPGRHWRTDVGTLEQLDCEGLLEWSVNGNPRKKIFSDSQKGKRMQDIWEFKDPPYPVYPTEKNADMLKLIVETSSDPDSIVLDCFCGSGAALEAAQRRGRRWIGVDISESAIAAARKRLDAIESDLFNASSNYGYIELN